MRCKNRSIRCTLWCKEEKPWLNTKRAEVYLHGKHIATHWYGDGVVSDDPMYTGSREESTDVEVDTFRRWPTTTTRSRLRALGINASIKQGQACIDGVPV